MGSSNMVQILRVRTERSIGSMDCQGVMAGSQSWNAAKGWLSDADLAHESSAKRH
jgi:hypothetical protein